MEGDRGKAGAVCLDGIEAVLGRQAEAAGVLKKTDFAFRNGLGKALRRPSKPALVGALLERPLSA